MPLSVVTPQQEFVDIRGLRHRLLHWGPASSDPIVLLHGFLDCAETFQFLVDELPRDWSFTALDWRGFGDSAHAQQGYWFPDYLADLDVLLERLGSGGPLRVIGHSMGGNVALIHGGVRPGSFRWIASLEGFGLARTRPEDAPARYAEWLESLRRGPRRSRYRSVEQLAGILRTRNPRLSAERANFIARAWTRVEGDEFALRADPAHRHANPVLYRRDENEACWQRIDVPVLMLLAGESEYLPRLAAEGTPEYLARHLRHLTLRTLPGVGHMMHHEDPALVGAAIRAFAEGVT